MKSPSSFWQDKAYASKFEELLFMCRFIAYLGKPIMADELLLKPSNSLVHQSYLAGEMSQVLNGDGFGIGW